MKSIKGKLWFQILLGMAGGLLLGILLSPSGGGLLPEKVAEITSPWIALPGNLFLALIKMVVIPLVLSSIVLGLVSSEDTEFLKRVGMRIFPYFVATTIVAITTGICCSSIIAPGKYIDTAVIQDIMEEDPIAEKSIVTETDIHLADRLIDLIPTNYVKSALDQDMLATVILAMFLGVAMAATRGKTTRPLLELFHAIQEISLKVIEWAMKLAPIAVFGLICAITMRVGFDALKGMAAYMGTVLLGLLLLLVFYMLMVFLVARMSPVRFLSGIREVQLLAFSTSSSAAVMPLSMQTAEQKLNVSPELSRFIIPLGATINMDGTALYQVSAAVFLTQVYGIDLHLLDLIVLAATTVGASIGTPSTPGVGIVVLATILQGIGVPPSGIALIIGVDRILDMSRTTVNVTGDLTACVLMNRWLKKDVH